MPRPAGGAAAWPCPEQHHPPRLVGRLDQVRVAGVLDLSIGAAVAQHRIGRAWCERAVRAWATSDRDAVAPLGPALRDEQVPEVADPVQVRRFLGLDTRRAAPEPARLTERLPGDGVDPHLIDPAVRAPATPLVVPGEIRVDAGDPGDPDRLRPGPGRVGGGEQQGAAVMEVRGDQPEPAVVVAQGRRVDATRRWCRRWQPQLARPLQRVADLRPVHQVPAVEAGTPGKYSKLEHTR